MRAPFTEIEGRRHLWRDMPAARRPAGRPELPALFEWRDDCPPTTELTAGRYTVPSVFASFDRARGTISDPIGDDLFTCRASDQVLVALLP